MLYPEDIVFKSSSDGIREILDGGFLNYDSYIESGIPDYIPKEEIKEIITKISNRLEYEDAIKRGVQGIEEVPMYTMGSRVKMLDVYQRLKNRHSEPPSYLESVLGRPPPYKKKKNKKKK